MGILLSFLTQLSNNMLIEGGCCEEREEILIVGFLLFNSLFYWTGNNVMNNMFKSQGKEGYRINQKGYCIDRPEGWVVDLV